MMITEEAERIRRPAAYYVRKFNTNNPFAIADNLGILYQIGNCKY